ncbi:GumC family protein [Parvularcula marina]|nr:polysaccharide biosynthesis tyrosine autokinase [Parvularcula marina]
MNAFTQITMPMQQTGNNAPAIDLPALWSIFRRRFRIFVAAAIVTLALVTVITFQMTPKYTAEARVVLNARETQALDVSAIISGISPDAATVETEVQIIRSRSMAERVADELNLFEEPEFNPSVSGKKGFFSGLFPSQLSSEDNDRMMRSRVINRVLDAVEVERAGITHAISIRVESKSPSRAADIANAFAEQYLVDSLDKKFETYQIVSTYLSEAVTEHRVKLRIAEDAIETYRAENGLLSAEGSLLSEQQIADLQAQLIASEAELAERLAKLRDVNQRLAAGVSADAIADVLASPVISDLRAKQADLARRRADLESRYGPLHPSLDNLKSEEADLQGQVQAEIDRIVGRLESDVSVARERVGSIRSAINGLRSDLSTDNQALVRLRELEREADVSRKNYEALLARAQQAELFEDLAEADARIADRAAVPTSPSSPNKKLNLALGIILGGAMGGLMIVLAEIFDNGIRTAEDIERTLNTNLVALVPALTPEKLTGEITSPQDYLVEKPLSSFAESYRTLRTALTLGKEAGSGGRVIALTSALSGEGKSSSAMCLGRISALSGDKVLVIDCDVRRRMLSTKLMDDDAAPRGLAEVLRGDVPLRNAILKDDKSDLRILPVSEDRSGLGDLFGSGRFEALLSQLRTKFDLIILDTAPLTAVADTRMVVSLADKVVQFVKWKQTPVTVARTANKILGELDTELAGAVLSQVDMRAQAGYGYEGSYRYYAQHGKYYYD